jgi:peptidoglycan hydrolase-like protein with peptidoglycan-binding domain
MVLVAGAVILLVAATAVVSLRLGRERVAERGPVDIDPTATTRVTMMTIAETVVIDGELGYGTAEPVATRAVGTVTWLPAAGAVLTRGDVLLRVDEKPVLLLHGDLPMYRPLAVDTAGRDVEQFEANLAALGYPGFTVDEKYTDATVAAVKRWQRDVGLSETGVVDVATIVYVPGTIRVATRSVRVGADAQGQVLTYTADTRVVVVDAPAQDTRWAVPGTAVAVLLPDGTSVPGTVSSIGNEATVPPSQDESAGAQDSGAAAATVPVTVAVAHQTALGTLDRAPVEVRYTAQQRPDVLTVPVAALLAPIDGGYAVEVVDGHRSRVVAVETGLFADGRVEIRGAGIAAGTTVRVPS